VLPNNQIIIYDCGPEVPPICYDGNDPVIGTGTKEANGNFSIPVSPPLHFGQRIYFTDGCFDPLLVSPFAVVDPRAAAPLLPGHMLAGLVALLLITGGASLATRKRTGTR